MRITDEESQEIENKIQKGLDLTYEKLLAEKREKKSEIVVLRDDEIITIQP